MGLAYIGKSNLLTQSTIQVLILFKTADTPRIIFDHIPGRPGPKRVDSIKLAITPTSPFFLVLPHHSLDLVW